MHFDHFVVGQGLAGTFLSWNLIGRGKKVLVIDEAKDNSSSKVASGVINPVTGRRLTRSWMIDKLMPAAVASYTQLGAALGEQLISRHDVLNFFPTPQMKLAFGEQLPAETDYLRLPENENDWLQEFRYAFGYGIVGPAWVINLSRMIAGWREKLRATGALLEEKCNIAEITATETRVQYKTYTADKIFFCDGAAGHANPWFHLLPFARNKGQALIVEIPGLPRTNIYKHSMTIVPWQDDLFWVGSSYEWKFENEAPSPDFREKAEAWLQQWLHRPYRVVDHIAAERPATVERRPFVGLHPTMPSVGILNGLGTKGCTLAPFFAAQLTEHLLDGAPIEPAADVQRFSRILARQNL